MRRIFFAMMAVVTIFACISPISAHSADEDILDDVYTSVDDLLDEYDLGFTADMVDDLGFGDIWEIVTSYLLSHLAAPRRVLIAILSVILLTACASAIGGGTQSEILYSMVCVLAAVTVIAPQLIAIYGDILGVLETCGGFLLVYVPIFSAVVIANGGFSSAGVYHAAMLGCSELIIKLAESYLLPILGAMTGIAVTGSIFPDTSLDSVAELLKKAVTWAISIVMALFVGFVTLKCSIAGKADGAAAKTVKMLVSGFVPIVGGTVSDAYSTVKGSFEVMSGSVGAVGIIAVAMLILPKVLELTAYRLVMWVGSTAAEMFSVSALAKLLKSVDCGLAIAQCVMVCYGVIFVLCTAILQQAQGA